MSYVSLINIANKVTVCESPLPKNTVANYIILSVKMTEVIFWSYCVMWIRTLSFFNKWIYGVSEYRFCFVAPLYFLREAMMSWAVSMMTTDVCGFITSTMSASGPRRSRGTRPETKRAFLKTTVWPAASSGRYMSPERKRLWTYTCHGITCSHGDLLYKVSNRESASSQQSLWGFFCLSWHLTSSNFFQQVPSQGMTSTVRQWATTWSAYISTRTSSCLPQPTRPSTLPSAYCS